MIYTEEIFEIEDSLDALCDKIMTSSIAKKHLENRLSVATNPEVKMKEKKFVRARDKFEQIEAYGKYAPDYTDFRRTLRQEKRALDMDVDVSSYRISERELQNVLDLITYEIAQSVSTEIKIDAGNPFFEFAQRGCGGSCSVG